VADFCYFFFLKKVPEQHGEGNFLEIFQKTNISHLGGEKLNEIAKIFGGFGKMFCFFFFL
jgi:hypothetical protein